MYKRQGLTGRTKVKAWRNCGCVWGVDLYIRGVRTWHNLGPDEAAAKVAELRLRADNAEQRATRRRPGDTVEEILDAWLTHKKAAGAKIGSVANYQSHITRLNEYFGEASVDIITTDTVRRLSDDLRHNVPLEPRSVNAILSTMSAAFRHARRAGVTVPTIEFADTKQVVARTGNPWLMTITECRRVITTCTDPHLQSMLEFALLTGMRRGEILGLTVDDIDITAGVAHVRRTANRSGATNEPKTRNSRRAVTLSDRGTAIAVARIEHAGPSRRLWEGSISTAGRQLQHHLKEIGLYVDKRGWHCFRHAHTAILDEADVSLRDAAARLGHGANYAQTNAYGWASEQTDVTRIDEVIGRHD